MEQEVVNELCAVLERASLSLGGSLSVAGAIVEMLLVNNVEPQHRLEAADKFHAIMCKRIRLALN